MKLRLHHIEMCVKDPGRVLHTLCHQFGLKLVGRRETGSCEQHVVKLGRTVFVVTSRKRKIASRLDGQEKENGKWSPVLHNSDTGRETGLDGKSDSTVISEPWTIFCCEEGDAESDSSHIDSVFNIAIEVTDLQACLERLKRMDCMILHGLTPISDQFGTVTYAIVKSCCGNVVHTLIEKREYAGWFLPTFELLTTLGTDPEEIAKAHSYFDHVALVCRTGGTNSIISWYEDVFEMRRFITNRTESVEDGLVIGDDVGMRLKVMEFWKCSEVGLASSSSDSWEKLKIVVAESLPNIQNTQVENFINDHNGPGLQHIGLHTPNMVKTVEELVNRGVRFRQPPPTYYTEVGQLLPIQAVGEDVNLLAKYGILLDDEADPFDEDENGIEHPDFPKDSATSNRQRYLMQIFTHPIFDRDTFFLEVIQRKGARGFGVGNVTALARSVNAYQEEMRRLRELKNNNIYA